MGWRRGESGRGAARSVAEVVEEDPDLLPAAAAGRTGEEEERRSMVFLQSPRELEQLKNYNCEVFFSFSSSLSSRTCWKKREGERAKEEE